MEAKRKREISAEIAKATATFGDSNEVLEEVLFYLPTDKLLEWYERAVRSRTTTPK